MADDTNTPTGEAKVNEPSKLSLEMLDLQRVDSAQPQTEQSTRKFSARVRKPCRLYFKDTFINDDKPPNKSLVPEKIPLKSLVPVKKPLKRLGSTQAKMSPSLSKERKIERGSANRKRRMVMPPSKISAPLRDSLNRKISISGAAAVIEPSIGQVVPADRKICQLNGSRLRSLLKLPKSYNWVIYEWFYSSIDAFIINGENDFKILLAKYFPTLETCELTRANWRKLRTRFGKPRRCSQAFFDEERRQLEFKRQQIRYVQTYKWAYAKDRTFVGDLPNKIPLLLPVGTRVTARLWGAQDGLYCGVVSAFDSKTSVYRVLFNHPVLGSRSVPDYEIAPRSISNSITIGLMNEPRGEPFKGMCDVSPVSSMGHLNATGPLADRKPCEPVSAQENIPAYPVQWLEKLARLKQALAIKRSKVECLRELNDEAELKINDSYSKEMPRLSEEFQRRYTSLVISLNELNSNIQDNLHEVQTFHGELIHGPQAQDELAESELREQFREAAEEAVERNSHKGSTQNEQIIHLVKKLSTLLVTASHLGNENSSAQVSKVLDDCVEEARSSLFDENVQTFQKTVLAPLNRIRRNIEKNMQRTANKEEVGPHRFAEDYTVNLHEGEAEEETHPVIEQTEAADYLG